jgi:hypothetical protein
MLLVFSRRAAGAAGAVLAGMPAAIRVAGHRVLHALRRYSAYRLALGTALACSIGVQVLRIVQAYYLGLSLGIAAPLALYFAGIPLILLVMLLPVTISGLGTGQAAFVWFFGRFDIAAAPAFTLSLLFIGLAIVGNLPGGVLFAWGRGRSDVAPLFSRSREARAGGSPQP